MGGDYANTACPYCSVSLDPLPKAKKECPACGRPIYVRSGPGGKTYLLQEQDLLVPKDVWAQHLVRRDWIKRAEPFTDEQGFDTFERELATWGMDNSPREVYWTAAIHALVRILASGDWPTIRDAYFYMALATYEEAAEPAVMPEQSVDLMREANKAQLQDLISRGVERVEILAEKCRRCQRDQPAKLDPRAELKAPRIPHADCESGWCSCGYVASRRTIPMHRPAKPERAGPQSQPAQPRRAHSLPETRPPANKPMLGFALASVRPLEAVGPGKETAAVGAQAQDCPHCSESRAHGAAFCRACGRPLSDTLTPSEPPTVRSRRWGRPDR